MIFSRRGRYLSTGLLALAHLPLQAQTDLPTIVISASRTEQASIEIPASITVIGRAEIEESAARDLVQLLQSRSGIQVNSIDSQNTTLDLRGFGATALANTLILVDGRRLNNSGDMAGPDLYSIDLRRVERIEIVQGSAGTLYGNQAVGGMINIITRQTDAFSADIEVGMGSFHGRSLSADLGQRLANGFAYRLSASRRKSDNYRENNENDRNDLNLRLDYHHDDGTLFLEHQWVVDNQQQAGALFLEEYKADRRQSTDDYAGDYSDSKTRTTRLGLSQDINDTWSFEGEASYRRNEKEFQNSFRGFPGSRSTQDRRVKSLNPRLISMFPLPAGEATLTAGIDLERTDYSLLSAIGPQRLEQSVDALYLQITAPVSANISTTLGWRRSRVDNLINTGGDDIRLDDILNAGSLGLVIKPSKEIRLFVRVDENFRFATVEEHTNPVYGQPVGIKNQTGLSHEAGIEWKQPGLTSKAVLYRLDLENEISFDSSGYCNINLEKTRRDGVILEASWQAFANLRFNGSFTYTDPAITAGPHKGNPIPLVSSRAARLNAEWSPLEHWTLFAEEVLRSSRAFGGDFANQFGELPGYGLLNAGAHFRSGPWHISLRADNLLDKAYAGSGSVGYDASFTAREAYFPAPERRFWLAADYRFE
jgi:iron complex outermembrane recepter protein